MISNFHFWQYCMGRSGGVGFSLKHLFHIAFTLLSLSSAKEANQTLLQACCCKLNMNWWFQTFISDFRKGVETPGWGGGRCCSARKSCRLWLRYQSLLYHYHTYKQCTNMYFSAQACKFMNSLFRVCEIIAPALCPGCFNATPARWVLACSLRCWILLWRWTTPLTPRRRSAEFQYDWNPVSAKCKVQILQILNWRNIKKYNFKWLNCRLLDK